MTIKNKTLFLSIYMVYVMTELSLAGIMEGEELICLYTYFKQGIYFCQGKQVCGIFFDEI